MRRNYVGSVIWTVQLNGKRWKEIKNSIRIYAGLFITEKTTEKSIRNQYGKNWKNDWNT